MPASQMQNLGFGAAAGPASFAIVALHGRNYTFSLEHAQASFARASSGEADMADDATIFIGASRKPDDSYQQPEKMLL